MEYNLHRDFNASFAIDFKRYTQTSDLLDAVDRYVTSQGNQAGLHNLAEILYNMVYNYTPSIADDVMPQILNVVKQNGSQAGLQAVASVMEAIADEGLSSSDATAYKALVNAFVEQNDNQLGLPILYGTPKVSYSFGKFLKDFITLLSA